MAAEDQPRVVLTNGLVKMEVLPPDAKGGYYQGTRFDWSGQVASLEYRGHNWFGRWNAKYDPKLHDAIMGPVEEFRTRESGPGYDEAQVGEAFLRIGVGAVRKPEEKAYQTFKTYEIVDPGVWTVRKRGDRMEFIHRVKVNGYGYEYRKTLRLLKGQAVLEIEHSLKNTGTKTLETEQYNHNFFVMDGKPTGPQASVEFGFEARATADLKGMAAVEGRRLVYRQELAGNQSVFTQIEGYSSSAKDYNLRVEHQGAGIGVHITGDQPITKFVFWSIRSTFCPEPYVTLKAAPGETAKWKYRYEFYELK